MAKFLSIYVTNTGLTAGERLINADQITTVAQTAATTTVITLAEAGATVVTLTHTDTGTTPSVRDAINDAITAVPGGQTVVVSLPVGIVCSSFESAAVPAP